MLRAAASNDLAWQRAIVFLLVVAAHVWLLRLQWSKAIRNDPAVFESWLLLLPDNAPNALGQKQVVQKQTAPPKSAVSKAPAFTVQALPLSSDNSRMAQPPNTEPDGPPDAPIDWQAESELAAQRAGAVSNARPEHRVFGNARSPPNSAMPSTSLPSMYKEPKHRFGETTITVEGDSVLWLNERCYQILKSDSSRFKAFSEGRQDTSHGTIKCYRQIGKLKPRRDLFEQVLPRREATAKNPTTESPGSNATTH